MKQFNQMFAAGVLGSFVLFGVFMYALIRHEKIQQENNAIQIRMEGMEAFKAGVPANANPRIKNSDYAQVWIEGWIEASKEEKR